MWNEDVTAAVEQIFKDAENKIGHVVAYERLMTFLYGNFDAHKYD